MQQVRKSHDGIERGADFVGHIGQEDRLQTARIVGAFRLLLQLLLLLHHIGNIPDQTETPCQCSIVIKDRNIINLIPLHFTGLMENRSHMA